MPDELKEKTVDELCTQLESGKMISVEVKKLRAALTRYAEALKVAKEAGVEVLERKQRILESPHLEHVDPEMRDQVKDIISTIVLK